MNFRSRDVPSYLPLILLDNTGAAVNGVVATDFTASAVTVILNGTPRTVTFDGYVAQLLAGPTNTGVYYLVLQAGYWSNFFGLGSAGTVTWVALPSGAKFVNYIGNATVEDMPNVVWDHGVWQGALGTMGGALRAIGAFFLGRYKVDTATNTRTTYKEDNVTPLATGATHDAAGAPSTDPIFETVTAIDADFPAASGSHPANGATGVPVNTFFDVTFTEDIDPASVTPASLFIKPTGGSPVAGTVTQLATTLYRFTPSAPLSGSASYQGVATTAVKDPWGNALAAQLTAGFTTA